MKGDRPDELRDLRLEFTPSVWDDTTAARITYRLGEHRYGALMVLSNELLADAGVDVERFVWASMDRRIRPWLYPDRPRWPHFDPFPRWTRLTCMMRTRWLRFRALWQQSEQPKQ